MRPIVIIPNAIMQEMAVDVWKKAAARTDEDHTPCVAGVNIGEADPDHCGFYEEIRSALEKTLTAHGYRVAPPEDKA